MKRILRIGMDVHSTNYTLCAMEPVIGEDTKYYKKIHYSHDVKAKKEGQILFTMSFVQKERRWYISICFFIG